MCKIENMPNTQIYQTINLFAFLRVGTSTSLYLPSYVRAEDLLQIRS